MPRLKIKVDAKLAPVKGLIHFIVVASLVVVSGCKSMSSATKMDNPKNDAMDAYLDDDLRRVNGTSCDQTLKQGRSENLELFANFDYDTDKAVIKKSAYCDLWKQYQFLLKAPQDQYVLQGFEVTLHIRQNRNLDLYKKTPPPKTLGASNLPTLEKTCASSPKGDDNYKYFTLRYNLLNYEQPGLARNFLILAKLGFYDGKSFVVSPKYELLMNFGSEETLANGEKSIFYLIPDKVFTKANRKAPASDAKDPDVSESMERMGITYQRQVIHKRSSIDYSALAAPAYNFEPTTTEASGERPESRRLSGTIAAISNYSLEQQEINNQLGATGTFPVSFGELVEMTTASAKLTGAEIRAPFGDAAKNPDTARAVFATIFSDVNAIPAKRSYDVLCVAIKRTDTKKWPIVGI